MSNLIAKKYAKALLELEGISLDDAQAQLQVIADVISSSKDVKDFLESPLIKSDKKFEAVVEPLKDKLDKKVVALLELMSQKGRLSLIPDLSELLNKEIMIKSNNFIGVVESSDELDADLKKKLEEKLEKYSGAKVELESKKSNIDGIKVEVSDLGLELNFSKESVKQALLEHILKAL